MKITLWDDQLQEFTTDTCGIFQSYFYKNLFDPVSDSKIIDDEFLINIQTNKKKTVATLFNEIFSTNKETNEEQMKVFAKNNDL